MCGMVGYIDMYQPKGEASVFIANGNLEISTVILQEFLSQSYTSCNSTCTEIPVHFVSCFLQSYRFCKTDDPCTGSPETLKCFKPLIISVPLPVMYRYGSGRHDRPTGIGGKECDYGVSSITDCNIVKSKIDGTTET